VELLIAAFIDVRPHEPALDFLRVIPLEDLKAGRRHSAVARSADDFLIASLTQLDDWIVATLRSYDGLVVSDTASNSYLKSVLQVLTCLVRFGVYSSRERVTTVIGPILNLIDGTDDLPSPRRSGSANAVQKSLHEQHVAEWRRVGRFEKNRDNQIAVDVKIAALTSLEILFHQTHFFKLRHLVVQMKEVMDWSTAGKKATVFTGTMPTDLAQKLKRFTVDLPATEVLQHTSRVRHYLERIHGDFDFVLNNWSVGDAIEGSIVATLFDLARYKFSTSLRKSVMMISAIFNSTERLLQDASHLLVLTETVSVKFMGAIQPLLHVLLEMSAGYVNPSWLRPPTLAPLHLLQSRLQMLLKPSVF
jgi:hypothetical protein